MVTKTTANVRAKKDLCKKKEEYRLTKPCAYCGSPLNTMARVFGHSKTVCQAYRKENLMGKSKTTN